MRPSKPTDPPTRGASPPAFRTDRKITLTLSVALGFLAVIALVALAVSQRLLRDGARVAHTYEVRSVLRTLDSQLRESKSNVRSFLITGDSAYLARFEASVDTAQRSFREVQRLTADNPSQQVRLDALRSLLAERLDSFRSTIAARPVGRGGIPDSLRAHLAIGELLSQRMGRSVAEIDSVESDLLEQRVASQRDGERNLRVVVLALAALGTGLAWAMRRSLRRDLGDRTRMENALRESEAKFSGILSIAADAIITVDSAQKIRHFNHGAEQIFGYREADVVGQPLDLLLPERLASTHRAHVAAFARSPEVARRMGDRRQVMGRRHTGEEFPADASISKLLTPQGPLFTVVLRDVTEQRRLQRHEHVLADAGSQLVGTLDQDALAQLVADLPVPEIGDWCLLDLVDEWEGPKASLHRVASRARAVESSEGEAALRAIEARKLTEDSPSRVLDVLRTATAELVPDVSDAWLEAHSDPDDLGAMRALEVRSLLLVPLVLDERRIGVLTIGSARARRPLDASDLALAQAIAQRATLALASARQHLLVQRATAARDEVLSVVSHDLRNPLSAVGMYARTLLDHPPSEETERRKLYQSMLDAAAWMHHLMQDLLDAASIDAGRLAVELEPQSVPHLVEASFAMFAGRAAAQDVALVADIPPDLPLVHADGTRILQVLGNLLGNALKYSGRGATITVGATARGSEVFLFVRDTGAGIAPEHVPHIFDRFWQVRGASRTRGTGLGLAIAHGIVTAHGGRIWVESRVGAGSTFWFTLARTGSSRTAAPALGHQRESQTAAS